MKRDPASFPCSRHSPGVGKLSTVGMPTLSFSAGTLEPLALTHSSADALSSVPVMTSCASAEQDKAQSARVLSNSETFSIFRRFLLEHSCATNWSVQSARRMASSMVGILRAMTPLQPPRCFLVLRSMLHRSFIVETSRTSCAQSVLDSFAPPV